MKFFAALLLVTSIAQAATYKLDPAHTNIGFQVKHLMVSKVRGQFQKFDGQFDYDSAKHELKNVVVNIDTSSINTQEPDRDKHLKSNDFFNAEKYPKMTFKGEKVEWNPDGKSGKITGPLTIRDKTQPITLDFVYNGEAEFMGTKKIGFSAAGKMNRKDYGVAWNKTLDKGGVAVSDEVDLIIEGEANMDAGKAPAKK